MDRKFQSRPFILAKSQLDSSEQWFDYVKPLSSAFLYYDEKTSITVQNEADVKMILIGYMLDIRDGGLDSYRILSALCREYAAMEEDFYEHLDHLNGRYVLIVDDGTDTRLFTDATCLRPVFHWNNEMLASHEALLREAVKVQAGKELPVADYRMNGFLDLTSTEGIYKVNPNHFFSARQEAFQRYYPREDAKMMTTDDVFSETVDFFPPQVEWLGRSGRKIHQSLTGGYDSKVSLALTKGIMDQIDYFTYMIDLENAPDNQFGKIYKRDKDLVDRLVYNLNLHHDYYFFKDYKVPDDYNRKLRSNVSSHHSFALSYLTSREFDEGGIHVKSTIYEMAKLPYDKKYDFKEDDASLVDVATAWAPQAIREDREKLETLFEAFKERNGFDAYGKYGYNVPAALYWETRMSNWHSNITQETDTTLETFILVNNRYMLDRYMRMGTADRENKGYLTRLISEFWPILNYFVPNRYETLEDKVQMAREKKAPAAYNISLSYGDVRFRNINNLDLAFNTDGVEMRPMDGTALKDDTLSVTLENKGEQEEVLMLKGYYEHPVTNIEIAIDDAHFSINDFIQGKTVAVPAGGKTQITYHYAKNFDRKSWYRAGLLSISPAGG
ncbi:hypothetical protein [Salinicoccus roseus]|uniref:Uncharacterized protein n=1 Tax=Salinicoccus roseus TaxID=45670 RepID=A0A265E5V7_9STAP|nr:hypothetical protein [Salinicoccus roseus]OZT76900.1 hypothetical protein CFN03_07415 [Salinicoccus roseus]